MQQVSISRDKNNIKETLDDYNINGEQEELLEKKMTDQIFIILIKMNKQT